MADLNRSHVNRRVSQSESRRYDELYPYPPTGCLLRGEPPARMARDFGEVDARSFLPVTRM